MGSSRPTTRLYGPGETLTYAAQRLLASHAPAREFPRSMISKAPFANEVAPPSDAFKRHQATGFSDWRLIVDGMVANPASLSLSDLRSLPFRSQITEVACEEGWSYSPSGSARPSAKFSAPVGVLPHARYIGLPLHPDRLVDSLDKWPTLLHPYTYLTVGPERRRSARRFGGRLRMRDRASSATRASRYITNLTATDNIKASAKASASWRHPKAATPGTPAV